MINELIERELEKIIKLHGYYNSDHEFYGVLKEEFEEAREELDSLENYIYKVWENIRLNEPIEDIDLMKGIVIRGIKELVQIAAVLEKAKYKDNKFAIAVKTIIDEFNKDTEKVSTYNGWKSNIDCDSMDEVRRH